MYNLLFSFDPFLIVTKSIVCGLFIIKSKYTIRGIRSISVQGKWNKDILIKLDVFTRLCVIQFSLGLLPILYCVILIGSM